MDMNSPAPDGARQVRARAPLPLQGAPAQPAGWSGEAHPWSFQPVHYCVDDTVGHFSRYTTVSTTRCHTCRHPDTVSATWSHRHTTLPALCRRHGAGTVSATRGTPTPCRATGSPEATRPWWRLESDARTLRRRLAGRRRRRWKSGRRGNSPPRWTARRALADGQPHETRRWHWWNV